MARKLKIGIVGAGQIVRTIHIPILVNVPDVELSWVTDSNENTGRRLADSNRIAFKPTGEVETGQVECDIALLAIPNIGRRIYIDVLGARGASFYAEKPLALDHQEHLHLMQMFDSWRLAVGYQRRFYASTRIASKIVESGLLGRLRQIEIEEGGRVLRTGGTGGYQNLPTRQGGGITKNLGCHSLDLALYVSRAAGISVKHSRVEWDGETDRQAEAEILLTPDGEAGEAIGLKWRASWLKNLGNFFAMHFDNGTVKLRTAPESVVELISRSGQTICEIQPGVGDGAITSTQAFYLQWRDLIDAHVQKREPLISGRKCALTSQIMDDILLAGAA